MAIRYKDSNGNWITGQKAIETQLIDAQGNFVATNVEDALQEIKVEVDSLSRDMIEVKEAIEWLKENGGGGGGENGENGSIELSSTFDYEVEYGLTDDIRLTYNIETVINEEIKLYLNINGAETVHVSQNGYNFIDLKASDLGLGTHPVTMYAKVDKFVSRGLRFNIVVVYEGRNTSVVVLDIPSDNYKVTVTMGKGNQVLFSEPPLIAWGDDSTSVGDSVLEEEKSTKDFSHTYAQAGKYVVKLKNGVFYYNSQTNFKNNIYKIVSLFDNFPIETNHFRQSPKLVEANISNAVIKGTHIIYYCPKLTKVIANNVKATNIKHCFASCRKLTEIIGLGTWNTNELTDMTYAFEYVPLASLDDMANWNTENVVNMSYAFSQMNNITNLDFMSNWNLNKVNDMSYMFQKCTSLTSANLSGWDVGNVILMIEMFNDCSSLTSLNLSSLDVSNVTSMYGMFQGCSSLTSLNLDGWNTENLTNMGEVFKNCSSLKNLDLSHFKTGKVTTFYETFVNCKLLTDFNFLNSWDIGKVTNINSMLQKTGITGTFTLNWDLSNVVRMDNFLNGTKITDLNLRLTSNMTNIGFSDFACSSKLANWDGVDVSIINKKHPSDGYIPNLFTYINSEDFANSGNVNIKFYGTITRDMDIWTFLIYSNSEGYGV